MKAIILGLSVLLAMQAPSTTKVPLASLAGKWTTTFVPPPRNLPFIPPSFTIEIKDSQVLLTFERDKTPSSAVPFAAIGEKLDQAVSVMLVKPSNIPSRLMILRILGPDQLRVEVYDDPPPDRPGRYHEEIFKK
jgi:hypothetical protein